MAEGLLSQSLMEPSMFVNRKVTVPVGGTLICSVASFRHQYYKAPRHYKGSPSAPLTHRAGRRCHKPTRAPGYTRAVGEP